MALREDWEDAAGQKVDAAFLNQLGAEVNASTNALEGKSVRVMSQDDYDELETPDPDTIYVVIE